MHENTPAHYAAVSRFYRGSPESFCTAFLYDTKQSTEGGYMRLVKQTGCRGGMDYLRGC